MRLALFDAGCCYLQIETDESLVETFLTLHDVAREIQSARVFRSHSSTNFSLNSAIVLMFARL